MDQEAYIKLEPAAKRSVLIANACMFLCTIIYSFSVPIAFPKLLEYYDLMKYQAVLLGVSSFLGAIATLVGGRLGDLIGHKKMTVVCGLLRAVLQLASFLKPPAAIFTALYFIISIVSGLLTAMHYAVISDVCTPAEKPRVIGIFGTINGIAMILSIFGGGLFVDFFGAFSIFLPLVPLGLLSALLFAVSFQTKRSEKVRAIDVGGTLLIAGALGAITLWCNLSAETGRFSPTGILLLAACAVFTALFLRYEKHVKDPVLTFHLFRNRFFLCACVVGFLIKPMIQLCGSTLSIFGQLTMGRSASIVGTLALPKNFVLFILPAFLGAWVARNTKRFSIVMFACGASIALGSASAVFWDAQTPLLVIYLTMLVFGISTSTQTCFIQPYMQLSIHPAHIGAAGATEGFVASISAILVNTVYSLCYNAKYAEFVTGGTGTVGDAVGFSFRAVAAMSLVFGILILVCWKFIYLDPTSVDPRSLDDE